jgi:hypothetical protein
VVGLAHEAGQRRETAVEEQLEVAELARGEVPGDPVAGGGLELGGALGLGQQVHQLPAVGSDQMALALRAVPVGRRRRKSRDACHLWSLVVDEWTKAVPGLRMEYRKPAGEAPVSGFKPYKNGAS